MTAVLVKALQVILALSVLILIHEAGHFTFAKIFGIRVDKFFLFFDINNVKLLSTKTGWFSRICPWFKNSETEYGIGWLPLGGYCKINGMIDESMDTEFLEKEPKPYEFRSKAAWKRLLVMAGGVFYNFIFAVLAYISIMAIWGESYISNNSNAIYVNELSYEMGFRNGDRILSFDDYIPENFGSLQADLVRRSVHKATVLRGADTVDIYIDKSMTPQMLESPDMFQLAVPFVVDTIPPQSPNFGCGLIRGDMIAAIDGIPIRYVQDSHKVLEGRRDTTALMTAIRGADTLAVQVQVDSNGRALIYAQIPGITVKEYNMVEAIPAGIRLTATTLGGYLNDLKMVADPSTGAYKTVGSFIAIGQVFPSVWDWYTFVYMLALLSVMLGVMNLLPIPGLDGGHILFTIYEMVSGKKPSTNFLMAAQMVGMVILMIIMVYACGNDIGRLFN